MAPIRGSPPLLVFEARIAPWRRAAAGGAVLVLLLGGALALRFSPAWALLERAWGAGVLLLVVPLTLAITAAVLALQGWERRGSGRVEVHVWGIVVRRGRRALVTGFTGWPALRGYRDDDPSSLRLVRHDDPHGLSGLLARGDRGIVLPTPDEASRTALLALLDRHGVPRLEE